MKPRLKAAPTSPMRPPRCRMELKLAETPSYYWLGLSPFTPKNQSNAAL